MGSQDKVGMGDPLQARLLETIKAGREFPEAEARPLQERKKMPLLQRRASTKRNLKELHDRVEELQRDDGGGEILREELEVMVEGGPQGWVPITVLRRGTAPPGARLPAVIAIHSTGSSKEQQEHVLQGLARRGFLAVAPDCRHHGRRAAHQDAYEDALLRAFHLGGEGSPGEGADRWDRHPFLYDNVFDVICLVNYLEKRADVDATRVGITGRSLGGMVAWLAAAADPRIGAAAPLIGMQGFGWALKQHRWQGRVESFARGEDDAANPPLFRAAAEALGRAEVDAEAVAEVWRRLLPGLLESYDTPLTLPLVAPRPFLAIQGELDPRCPLTGVFEAVAAARGAYQRFPERLSVYVEPGVGHTHTSSMEEAAEAWLVRWLAEEPGHPTRVSAAQPRRKGGIKGRGWLGAALGATAGTVLGAAIGR